MINRVNDQFDVLNYTSLLKRKLVKDTPVKEPHVCSERCQLLGSFAAQIHYAFVRDLYAEISPV